MTFSEFFKISQTQFILKSLYLYVRYKRNMVANDTKNNVFDNWTEYQIRILFRGWETQTVWQFILSCVAIFGACLTLNLFVLLKEYIKTTIYSKYNRQNEERVELIRESRDRDVSYDKCCNCVRFGYFLISILYYMNLIFITLCATTFNPWICLSIVLGYSTGELMIFHKQMTFDYEKYA